MNRVTIAMSSRKRLALNFLLSSPLMHRDYERIIGRLPQIDPARFLSVP